LQPQVYKYEQVLAAFQAGERNFQCGSVWVPMEDIAPDICLSHIPEVKNVTVERMLGEGGFGVVYKGLMDGKEVAVKELTVRRSTALLAEDDESIDKFRAFAHEVWIMSKLDHPNLVKLYGITQQPLRMVMEYCPHFDLHTFLRKQIPTIGPQWSLLKLRIAIDIARGMAHLHSMRPPIVHRECVSVL